MERKGADRESILALLEEHGALTPDVIRKVSAESGIPEADVYGVATFYSLLARPEPKMRVCKGLSCELAGAFDLISKYETDGVAVEGVSCLGQCDRAPAVLDPELEMVPIGPLQGGLTPDDPNLPMNLAGHDDATYAALALAKEKGPDWVIEQIDVSGLQGRGGAGFPAGFKWKAVLGQTEKERYVVCNADEGEPGTFKDREIMLQRPHLLLEGLAIAAQTIGAETIIIYIRGEFSAERRAVETALNEASDHLTDFDFQFFSGHGAYICGEETSLLESLEGKRPLPRLKPPYPTESGFRSKPTLMNNVETLACVPPVLTRGGEWFKAQGRTEPGSKLYCISGHVQVPGVYELQLGVTLDELVEAAGGYVGTPMSFCPGGASSGFLPISERNQPLDFKGLDKIGSMLGSAGIVVLNDTTDIARATLNQLVFFEEESCGQCAPCRLGSRFQRRALERFLKTGKTKALEYVPEVAWEMEEGSICGLGMVAAWPITTAMKHFPEAFAEHTPKTRGDA